MRSISSRPFLRSPVLAISSLLIALVLAGCVVPPSPSSREFSEAMPFGLVTLKDIDRLDEHFRQTGVELTADLRRAYQGDAAALRHAFSLAPSFTKLDANARTYGQLVYSAMLNLGEQRGMPWFSAIVMNLPEPARQRIRDYLFYPATQVPAHEQAEVIASMRKTYPEIFPADYVFGTGNPLFTSR